MHGCTGRILEVNLSQADISENELDVSIYRKYLGGSGLAARLFFDRARLDAGPLSPENLLVFMNGPFAGLKLPGASRCSAAARSPLTRIWADSSCGGNFGPELKFAGYDGIIFKGQAEKPAYLFIDDDRVALKDASDLWGKDIYETTDILKGVHGKPEVKVVAIGQAGENLVKFASIHNDKAHTFGRTGLGAVMGSKNLKAVVVRGSEGQVSVARRQEYEEQRRQLSSKVTEHVITQVMHEHGTAAGLEISMFAGDVPTKNWQIGLWEEGAAKLTGTTLTERFLTRRHGCAFCPIACKRVCEVKEGPFATKEGPGPEFETIASFGTMLYSDALEATIKANELCNKYGMDSITCGSTIAWAIECFEKGILTASDTDGLYLDWNKPELILELLPKIANRKGLGDLLAEGSYWASQRIGRGSEDFTTCVNGLEAPMHDPRAMHGLGLAYAISTRGACHLSSVTLFIELGTSFYPEMGLDKEYEPMSDEFKAELVAKAVSLGGILNSLCYCMYPGQILDLPDLVGVLNVVTGFDWDISELMTVGERIWYLKRCLGHIFGSTANHDKLPKRIMTPVREGISAGQLPDMKGLLEEFYRLMELDPSTGRPSRGKLVSLGLEDIADKVL